MSNQISSLPTGWSEAYLQSTRRYLNNPKFFENGPIRLCLGGPECPQWRNTLCMASKCFFRYPTDEDLFECMEVQR